MFGLFKKRATLAKPNLINSNDDILLFSFGESNECIACCLFIKNKQDFYQNKLSKFINYKKLTESEINKIDNYIIAAAKNELKSAPHDIDALILFSHNPPKHLNYFATFIDNQFRRVDPTKLEHFDLRVAHHPNDYITDLRYYILMPRNTYSDRGYELLNPEYQVSANELTETQLYDAVVEYNKGLNFNAHGAVKSYSVNVINQTATLELVEHVTNEKINAAISYINNTYEEVSECNNKIACIATLAKQNHQQVLLLKFKKTDKTWRQLNDYL